MRITSECVSNFENCNSGWFSFIPAKCDGGLTYQLPTTVVEVSDPVSSYFIKWRNFRGLTTSSGHAHSDRMWRRQLASDGRRGRFWGYVTTFLARSVQATEMTLN